MPAKTLFNKEAIIDTAFNIALEEGFDHMTIRHIAQKMGSSIAPIYVNFKNTDELKEAVLNKAQAIFQNLIQTSKHEDLFLRYAIASIRFAKDYPKLYDTFLLSEDRPLDTKNNVEGMLMVLKQNPLLEKLDKASLMTFIISMQAFQVGLALMARKSYYKHYLNEDDMIKLIDDTGSILIEHILKEYNKEK